MKFAVISPHVRIIICFVQYVSNLFDLFCKCLYFRIYLSTWNVATNSPNEDLNALLDFPSIENKNHPFPDFYCLA